MDRLDSFLAGFKRFKKTFHTGTDNIYQSLSRRQMPKAFVIACCDSRVDPALLLSCRPGDIFVLRNIANLVPHSSAAQPRDPTVSALAYGVMHLGITDIVVLGHSNCGGIKALVEQGTETNSPQCLAEWIDLARPALELAREFLPGASPQRLAEACERISILLSVENLLSYPWIRKSAEAGNLILYPWYFNMEQGELLGYSWQSGRFEVLQHNAQTALAEAENSQGISLRTLNPCQPVT